MRPPWSGMNEHFRAFSFVDRIHALEPGVSIRGSYAIPSGLQSFPSSLVAEAVGQLAAWGAMQAVDFKRRPVAGLAGEIELLSPVRPGDVLELAADLETVDIDAAAYAGTAHTNGKLVIRLQHCVGPMMPLEEFDDPKLLHERFTLLQGAGATPGGFRGMPSIELMIHPNENDGQSLRATLRVPDSAPFFGDHFPRRPVFPGTLLMNSKLELAAALARHLPAPAVGGDWTVRGVSDMKLRVFTLPGETLEVAAKLHQLSSDTATVTVESRKGNQIIGGARVRLAPGERS
jgi:3-hydroxyacyl-[acyl-carrier-protein] dehydratase